MTDRTFKSQYLRESHERLMNSNKRAQSLAENLNAFQLNWKPSDDKWSIAQCLEHVLVGADLYGEKLGPAIKRAQDKSLYASANVQPRHTIIGGLILRVVDPTSNRTMSSPKIFNPAQTHISDDVLDRFIQSHENIAELISECDGIDFNRMKLSSPVARIIRINAADAFEILITHAKRHLNQADRVRQSSEFPA